MRRTPCRIGRATIRAAVTKLQPGAAELTGDDEQPCTNGDDGFRPAD